MSNTHQDWIDNLPAMPGGHTNYEHHGARRLLAIWENTEPGDFKQLRWIAQAAANEIAHHQDRIDIQERLIVRAQSGDGVSYPYKESIIDKATEDTETHKQWLQYWQAISTQVVTELGEVAGQ